MLPSEEQADYSFAEWWVLAQAHWLVMLYPSAYTITAAEVGFGTSGSARATAAALACPHAPSRRHAEIRLRAQHILAVAARS